MKLLYDLEALQYDKHNKYDGGAEYAQIVFFELIKYSGAITLLMCYNPNKNIPKDVLDIIMKNKIVLLEKKSNSNLNSILKDESIDKFYSAIPYKYNNVDFSTVKVYVTIHGLRSLELPTDFYEYKYATHFTHYLKGKLKYIFRNLYFKIKYKAQKKLLENFKNANIIAVSYHTKFAIYSYFPSIFRRNILTFYSPLKSSALPKTPDNLLNILDLENERYFLLVSSKRWTKNSYRALKAFKMIFDTYNNFNFKIICLGSKGLKFKNEFDNDNFIFMDYVESAHLEFFYKNAYAFVYPTLNEGFGYPPLEAMKYGVPILSSYVNSITEVCGDAPLYFNPYSIYEIANRILQISYDKEVYKTLKEKSKSRFLIVKKKQDEDLTKLIKYLIM